MLVERLMKVKLLVSKDVANHVTTLELATVVVIFISNAVLVYDAEIVNSFGCVINDVSFLAVCCLYGWAH